MMPYSLEYSAAATRALGRIERYIAGKGYPVNAAHFVARIQARCEKLCQSPLHGQSYEHRRPGMRSVGMEQSVSILYDIKGNTVRILVISHQGQRIESEDR